MNALPRKSPTLLCVPPVACILYELGAGVDFGFAERCIRLYVGTDYGRPCTRTHT